MVEATQERLGEARQKRDRDAQLAQPGAEQSLDVTAAARVRQAPAHAFLLDHDDRRHVLDTEAFRQLGMLVDVHVEKLERLVVAVPLQNLREVSLDTPRAT